jgi:plasmid stabilization system protein ParE
VRIVIAPLAAQDLQEAYDFIARDNKRAADDVLIHITEILGLLATGRVRGREVKLRPGMKVRTWSLPPYRIYYRILRGELQVIRIYHQSRRPIEG